MRLFELVATEFDPMLVEFWGTRTHEQMRYYAIADNCIDASNDLNEFLENQRIMTAEVIPIGQIVAGKKKYGWVYLDQPIFEKDALTNGEISEMGKLNLNPTSPVDIKTYAEQKGIVEELKWVPHSWVEIRGRILDPSGFYMDGKSGQFDRFVGDKTNLAQRYRYF